MGVQRHVQIRLDHLVFFEKRGVEVRNRYLFTSTIDISFCDSISSQTIRSVPSNVCRCPYLNVLPLSTVCPSSFSATSLSPN